MKKSNTLAGNATRNLQIQELLLNTKEQYMRESNILAGNATKNLHKREILRDTKGQSMEDSGIVICNLQLSIRLYKVNVKVNGFKLILRKRDFDADKFLIKCTTINTVDKANNTPLASVRY